MVSSQGQENLVDQDDVLEIVYAALPVEKVHGRSQPVPVEALCRAQITLATRYGGDSDHFLEGDDLDVCYNAKYVNVTHEEGGKKTKDHDKCPKRSCYEVLFLFLILGRLFLFRGGLL